MRADVVKVDPQVLIRARNFAYQASLAIGRRGTVKSVVADAILAFVSARSPGSSASPTGNDSV